jgi:hypothetical protein
MSDKSCGAIILFFSFSLFVYYSFWVILSVILLSRSSSLLQFLTQSFPYARTAIHRRRARAPGFLSHVALLYLLLDSCCKARAFDNSAEPFPRPTLRVGCACHLSFCCCQCCFIFRRPSAFEVLNVTMTSFWARRPRHSVYLHLSSSLDSRKLDPMLSARQ